MVEMIPESDYLWDKSGEPDPDVVRLEKTLARFSAERPRRRRSVRQAPVVLITLATAAVLILTFAVQTYLNLRGDSDPSADAGAADGWRVEVEQGAPRVDAAFLRDTARLGTGQWLETDDTSSAILHVADIGQVRVEPNTRLRLLATDTSEQRIRLTHGTVRASIWAPPRRFFVETPSAVAIDLGCVYSLSVDDAGNGTLCVESGWGSLRRDGREAIVPEGAMCDLRAGLGPGTPYLAGASSDYLRRLERFDSGQGSRADLEALIRDAQNCDVFSLVHLVSRVPADLRSTVFDRVASVVPPWPGITRAGIVALDDDMLEMWNEQFACWELELCRASCDDVQGTGLPLSAPF